MSLHEWTVAENTRLWRRVFSATVIVCFPALSALTACSPVSMSCAGYEHLGSPDRMYETADLVLTGTVGDERGQVTVSGASSTVHDVRVDDVFKGGVDGDVIRVAVPTDACASDFVDPLATHTEVLLFLRTESEAGHWVTLTPYEGVLPKSDVEDLEIPVP